MRPPMSCSMDCRNRDSSFPVPCCSYCGILTQIRTVFAQLTLSKNYDMMLLIFSFNQKRGQCKQCLGIGEIITTIPPLPKIGEICSVCNGKRYKEAILEIHFKGHSIADVLQLEVHQALVLFSSIPKLYRPLQIPSENRSGISISLV